MKRRKLLMIPGPIEFEPEVLRAMGANTTSHVAPNFIETFGHSIELMRKVWMAPTGQPFIVAGSGTLAMDMAACNLIEKGDNALVISSGYFGKRFQKILDCYGANTTILEVAPGEVVNLEFIEKNLKEKSYKLLTFTHVDTSTGVKVDAKAIAALAKKYNVLSILDGVCSVVGEEIRQEEWGIDIALTGSQKAVGVPPGLALLVASQKAMDVWKNRKTPVQNYYGDWANWISIMTAYEERRPSYFGTPAVNLVAALEVSLRLIDEDGILNRVQRHEKLADAFRKAMSALKLELLPNTTKNAANTLTAVYYPEGIDGAAFRKKVSEYGVIIAGGLLPELKTKYFRVGHMGAIAPQDLITTISAIEYGLKTVGYGFEDGVALKTFQACL